MSPKTLKLILLLILLIAVILTACAGTNVDQRTDIPELDNLIEVVLKGDVAELIPLIEFTRTGCTFVEGLGGPPKCNPGEQEGDSVAVLPFLGPEGHFIRQEQIDSWDGLDVSELYTVYALSDKVFTDPNYPAGEYALVFLAEDRNTNVTLQVKDGKIVRIDYGFGVPTALPPDNVEQYIFPKINQPPGG